MNADLATLNRDDGGHLFAITLWQSGEHIKKNFRGSFGSPLMKTPGTFKIYVADVDENVTSKYNFAISY